MQIVIDIDERDYGDILNGETKASALNWSTFNAIRNGTPLPKGHGRLIDADSLECDGFNRTSDDYAFDCIDNVPTIIEADKAESEEQENDIPWYLKIFNQDILTEYQKRMRDATPEEREKEVPYNDKGSSIHSEVYSEVYKEENKE